MTNTFYLKLGKFIFAAAILAIGIIHIFTGDFPSGLSPVPATVPLRILLVYLTGSGMVLAGLMLFIEKTARYGAVLAGIVWLLLLVLLHLPQLISNLHDPGPWTTTFETLGIISGAFFLIGEDKFGNKADVYKLIGRYLFVATLIIFGIQHYMYVKFISALIPNWLPGHLFWAWLVTVAFFAAAVSIIIHVQTRLTAQLLALMFLLWVFILHLPRAITDKVEPEWTSLFVAMAMGGVSLLLAATTAEKSKI